MPKLRRLLYAGMLLCLCAADQSVSDGQHGSLGTTSWTVSDEPAMVYGEPRVGHRNLPQHNRQLAQKADSAYSYYWIAPANEGLSPMH